MHPGGGCASHQRSSSGFKELADSYANPVDSFIVAWPQGESMEWGTCGSDCDKAQAAAGGKPIHSTDDITFISSMIARIIQDETPENPAALRVDPERIYSTGFSSKFHVVCCTCGRNRSPRFT